MTREAPAGLRWAWVPEERGEWQLPGPEDVRCSQRLCRNPPVAVLIRTVWRYDSEQSGRHVARRWRCCALTEHLYGRRVRDGVIEYQRLVPLEVST